MYPTDSAESGLITVAGHNSCGNGASSSLYVIANPSPPVPIITLTGDTLYSSSSTGNQWFFNNNLIPGATLPYLVYLGQGSYLVEVTNSFGCQSSSGNYQWLGIKDEGIAEDINVFPNPFSDILYVSAGTELKGVSIGLFDYLGKQVFSGTVEQEDVKIDASNFDPGIYFLIASHPQYRVVKVIKVGD
jgi:hypothetical protein